MAKYYKNNNTIKIIIYIICLPIVLIAYIAKLIININKKNTNEKTNILDQRLPIDNEYTSTTISKLIKNEKKYKITNIVITVLIILLSPTFFIKAPFQMRICIGLAILTLVIIFLCIKNKLNIINNQLLSIKYIYQPVKTENQSQLNNISDNTKDIIRQNDKLLKIEQTETESKETKKYLLKTKTLTENEKYFVNIIKKHYSNQYDIRVQVPLSSIIEKQKEYKNEYQNELNRIIDIGIFDKATTAPLLLIEVNDATHLQAKRKYRDMRVKKICEEAKIQLIAFWTNYSNTEQYIVERISKYLM